MKLQNKLVEPLIVFLTNLELPSKQSRMRSKLIKLAKSQAMFIEESHQELIKKYGIKDENGEVRQEERENGKVFVHIEDIASYNQDFSELMEELWILETNEVNKDMLIICKEIILDYDGMLKGKEADDYDLICDVFEKIEYK